MNSLQYYEKNTKMCLSYFTIQLPLMFMYFKVWVNITANVIINCTNMTNFGTNTRTTDCKVEEILTKITIKILAPLLTRATPIRFSCTASIPSTQASLFSTTLSFRPAWSYRARVFFPVILFNIPRCQS